MITLPLPDRSLAAVPLSLLGALLIFIAVRGEQEPDMLPLPQSMTDGSGGFPADAAHVARSGAALSAIPDVFDYTFVFPLHEAPDQDTRVVRLEAP